MRLFINNTPVDLSEIAPILINRSVADVREPEIRNFDFTKTIVVPATANNKRLFTHIYDLHYDVQNVTSTNFTPDFNPNLKALARVESGAYMWQGYAQLLRVVLDDVITFELQIVGTAGNFFKSLGNQLLSDLDFSRFDHAWNITNIANSWDTSIIDSSATGGTRAFQLGRGYVYNMMDNGFATPNTVSYTAFKPALFAKQIVDDIFSGTGYTYTADSFFNETFFKKLIIPYTRSEPVLADVTISSRLFKARRDATQTALDVVDDIIFNDDSTTGYYDNGADFNTGTGRYVVPATGKYSFTASIAGVFTYVGAAPHTLFKLYFAIYNYTTNTTIGIFGGNPINDGDSFIYNTTTSQMQCTSGDSIGVQVYKVMGDDVMGNFIDIFTGCDIDINANSTFENSLQSAALAYGDTIDMNSCLTDVEQRVYLMDLCRMFNLYIDVTDNANELRIVPRDEYYNTDVIDLTGKVDTVLEVIPMAELDANPYHFTYSEAGDAMNNIYKGEVGSIYGRKRYFVNNDFIKDEKKIELPAFIPTVSTNNPSINDRVLPNVAVIGGGTSSNNKMRILIYPSALTCQSWTLVGVGASVIYTKYAFSGMVDHPVTPSAALWFGTPEKQYYNRPQSTFTDNNLFNKYYRKHITEVTDKNSKVVVMNVNIRPSDMALWDFDNLYYYDHAYYYLNKIIDYNPNYIGDLTKCEFLKLVTGVIFTPTSVPYNGGDGTVGVDDLPPSDFVKLPIDDRKKDKDLNIEITTGGKVSVTSSANVFVMDGADNISIENSDGITILPNVINVKVSNSSVLEVSESNTVWINNVRQSRNGLPNVVVTDEDYTVTDEDVVIGYNLSADIDIFLPPLTSALAKPLLIKLSDNTYDIDIICDDVDEFFDNVPVGTTLTLPTIKSVTVLPIAGYWHIINQL